MIFMREKTLPTLLLRLKALRAARHDRPESVTTARVGETRPLVRLAAQPAGEPAGQSLIELAIFFPILLMLLSGVVEFGFLLNTYINLIDGPRDAARFAVDQSPFTTSFQTAYAMQNPPPDNPCFYSEVAAEAIRALSPDPSNPTVQLDPTQDDLVISVFAINNGFNPQITRYPQGGNLTLPGWNSDCPNQTVGESQYDKTPGEWHLYGCGSICVGSTNSHPSRFTSAQILAWEEQTNGGLMPPAMGVVLVEVYYGYHQMLKLPWLAFIGDPIRVYTYAIMPAPGAAPLVTPTPTTGP